VNSHQQSGDGRENHIEFELRCHGGRSSSEGKREVLSKILGSVLPERGLHQGQFPGLQISITKTNDRRTSPILEYMRGVCIKKTGEGGGEVITGYPSQGLE